MKKILSFIFFTLFALMAFAQTKPSKVDFNNFLIVAGFRWEISDLSFDDFERNVVIETINYKNQFGEMIREESGSKEVMIQYNAQDNVYRFSNCTINPNNIKRINSYDASSRLDEVYILPEQSGDVEVYKGSGAYKRRFGVEIDNQGRMILSHYHIYTYDDKTNNIIKKNGIGGGHEIEKTGADSWLFKDDVNIFRVLETKKITILERNEKGLWTRLIIEYMRDPAHNADPVKIEKIRYFDIEEDSNLDKKEADEETVKDEDVPIPFQLVEEKPSFNGGDTNEFSKWVNSHLVYPKSAKENGVQGRVNLQFTVNADGTVSDVVVFRGVDPALDAEAVRVVSSSPKWTPGKHRDRAVKVTYIFPVIFQLR